MYGFLDLLLDFSAAAMSPEARVVSSNQRKPSFDTVFVKAKIKFGSFAKVSDWLDTVIIDGKTPRQLIKLERAQEALDYINAMPDTPK
jgi:hypothetical protein